MSCLPSWLRSAVTVDCGRRPTGSVTAGAKLTLRRLRTSSDSRPRERPTKLRLDARHRSGRVLNRSLKRSFDMAVISCYWGNESRQNAGCSRRGRGRSPRAAVRTLDRTWRERLVTSRSALKTSPSRPRHRGRNDRPQDPPFDTPPAKTGPNLGGSGPAGAGRRPAPGDQSRRGPDSIERPARTVAVPRVVRGARTTRSAAPARAILDQEVVAKPSVRERRRVPGRR